MRRVHQNIVIDGVDLGDRAVRRNSKFCGQGKWDNFIKPLLPNPKELTLIEYGSNAGLFLKLAKEYGFDRVVGIEHGINSSHVAKQYREYNGLDYKLIHQFIGLGFDFEQLPLADVTLLPNFHYHQPIQNLAYILDNLETKTEYILLVGAKLHQPNWKTSGLKDRTEHYFRYWHKIGEIDNLPTKGDPHPREMYSILYQSPKIKRVPLHTIVLNNFHRTRRIGWASDFIRRVIKEREFDVRETECFKRLKVDPNLLEQRRIDILDMIENGIKKPIIIRQDNIIADGANRYLLLKELGYKTAIIRDV